MEPLREQEIHRSECESVEKRKRKIGVLTYSFLIRNLEVRDIGDINVHKINNTIESEMVNNDHSRPRNHCKTSVRETFK